MVSSNYFCLVQVLGNIGYAIISVWYKFLEIFGYAIISVWYKFLEIFGYAIISVWYKFLEIFGYAIISVLKGTLMLIVKKMQNIQIFQ